MKLKILIALFIASVFTGCNSQTGAKIIPAAAFAEKIKTPNAQLLDVRTPEEFKTEHLANAANINWNGDQFEAEAAKYDKTKPIFVYCRVGGRSAKAADKLSQMGFKEVYNLEGGIIQWTESGFPVKNK